MTRYTMAFVALLSPIFPGNTSWAEPLGPEFQVNTYTVASQAAPDVAGLADGGFVVAWQAHTDPDHAGIFGQRYDAAGARVGETEFRVSAPASSSVRNSSVAGLADGGFVVIWQAHEQGDDINVYGQRFDSTGKRVGKTGFRVNKTTADVQGMPSVAGLAGGGFVVTWRSFAQDGDSGGIYGQRYGATGKRVGWREFRVNKTTASNQSYPGVAALGDGGFAIAWQSYDQDGDQWGIYGQRYDANGRRVGKRELAVNKYPAGNQRRLSIAGLGDGGFVVTWQSYDQKGTYIFGQRFNATGKRVGTRDFRVVRSSLVHEATHPSVTGFAEGGFVITWNLDGLSIAEKMEVYGRRYNAAGRRVDRRKFKVNTYTVHNQYDSSVAGLIGGGFVATWQSYSQDGDIWGVYGQRFEALVSEGPPAGAD